MWSRSLLVQNLLVPKKAKPHDNDADSADAVADDQSLPRLHRH
jgi:RNA polymerase primary sigma factor